MNAGWWGVNEIGLALIYPMLHMYYRLDLNVFQNKKEHLYFKKHIQVYKKIIKCV